MQDSAAKQTTASVWRSRDFRLLLGGHTLSEFGSYVTMAAVPIIAVTMLQASPLTVSVISAAG